MIVEGVTIINDVDGDADGDYYADLDLKIRYKLTFWYHLFCIDVLKLKTSIENGFYNPQNPIFVKYYTWFCFKIHFSLWQPASILYLCKLSMGVY